MSGSDKIILMEQLIENSISLEAFKKFLQKNEDTKTTEDQDDRDSASGI